MDQKTQSFNLNADFFGGFTSIFMKLVFAIIMVYIIIMILNFLRDKFIIKEPNTNKDDIIDLLTILNKLFFISGFGFIVGNIVQKILTLMSNQNGNMPTMNFRGEWDYLTFGIILIFIGIGFKAGKAFLIKERSK